MMSFFPRCTFIKEIANYWLTPLKNMWYCVSKYQIIFYLLKWNCCVGPKTNYFYLSLGISNLCVYQGTSSFYFSEIWLLWMSNCIKFCHLGKLYQLPITLLLSVLIFFTHLNEWWYMNNLWIIYLPNLPFTT